MLELVSAHREFSGFTLVSLLFLLSTMILVARNHTVSFKSRCVFLSCLAAIFLITIADWTNYLCAGVVDLRSFHAVSMAATFAVAPALPAMIAQTVYPSDRVFRLIMLLIILQALLEIMTIFTGAVFYVDSTNTYHRGPLYLAYMLTYAVSSIYLAVQALHAGHVYQSADLGSIISILVVLFSGVTIQIIDSTVRTTWLAVAMSITLFFLFFSEMTLRSDALTLLLNRHSYDDFLSSPTLPCAVIVIDVDDFKYVNDTYGHAFGDVCLQTIAKEIRHSFSGVGNCYRTGGDEFCAIITKRVDNLAQYEESFMNRIQSVRERDGRIAGVSIGHAVADPSCTDLTPIIKQADQAMYAAKRAKKVGRS